MNQNIKKKIKLLLIIYIFAFYYIFPKNDINFDHLFIEQGLSQNSVYCISQDKNGFLWFGTDEGLNRYDGYVFNKFYSDYDIRNSISDNKIKTIFEDKEGILWIGTRFGFNRYDPFKDEIKQFYYLKDKNSISSNDAITVIEDKDGFLWIGTNDGLNRYDKVNNIFINFKFSENCNNCISNNQIKIVFEDSQGIIWVGTKGGLNRYNKKSNEFTVYKNDLNDLYSIPNNNVISISEDNNKDLWVGTDKLGLARMRNKSQKFFRYYIDPDKSKYVTGAEINSIYIKDKEKIWIGTYGEGIYVFDIKKKEFTNYRNSINNKSISSNFVFKIFQDINNILWIGTVRGLNKFDSNKNKFVHWELKDNNSELINNNIWNIYKEKKGNVWLGTENGILYYNLQTKTLIENKYFNKLKNNRIIIVAIDSNDNIWIGTDRSGLVKYNASTAQFFNYKYKADKNNSISGNTIYSVIESKNRFLWIGTNKGVNRFNPDSEIFESFNTGNLLNKNPVLSLYEDRSGLIWIGSKDGLYFFNPTEKRIKAFKPMNMKETRLKNNSINVIIEIKNKALVIGSVFGFYILDENHNIIKHYTKKHGLPSNDIMSILEDRKGNLWISTNNGISQFNPVTEEFRNYDTYDGLQSMEFNGGASYQSDDGEMFFGGVNGFNSFYPENIGYNKHKPPIVITEFKVFDRKKNISDYIENSKELILLFNQNFLSFEFTALDFTNPEKNKYAFWMIGVDKGWNYRDSGRRFANYTDLAPGHYIFKVKGSNNDGVWNEVGISVRIYISPPFWLTWWAYSIYTILVFLFFLIGHKVRVRQLKRRKRELIIEVEKRTSELEVANLEINTINKDLEQSMMDLSKMNNELREANMLKSEFLGIAAHDLKNPLQVILGYTDILKMKLKRDNLENKEIKKINRSVENMLALITELLKTASLETGQLKLNIECIDLDELLEKAIKANRTLAAKKDQAITYSKKTDIFIEGDSMKIMQVFDNLISNGIKYSLPGKNIEIIIGCDEDMAIVEVKDHGPGLTEDDKKNLFKKFQRLSAKPTAGESSTGLGLSICKGFVEKHHGNISVESEFGKGSTFIVKIPLVL